MSIKKAIFSLVGSLMTGYAAAVLSPVFASARHAQSRTGIEDQKKARDKRERRRDVMIEDYSTRSQSTTNDGARAAITTNSTSTSRAVKKPVASGQSVMRELETRRSSVENVTPSTPVFYRPSSYSPSRSTRSDSALRSHSLHRSPRSGR